MFGYDIKRFTDLSQSVAKHLMCSICAAILKSPLETKCKHNFCSQCIHQWLSDHNNCPNCRQVLGTRRTPRTHLSTTASEAQLEPNILAQNIINEFKYKCYTESNGCQRPIVLALMSTHLENCKHYVCDKCGLKMGKVSEHNCLQLMRNEMNDCKRKLKVCENKCSDLENENKKLKTNNEVKSGDNWLYIKQEADLERMECFLEHDSNPYKCVQIDVKSWVRLIVEDNCTDDPIPLFAVRMRPDSKFSTLRSCLRQTPKYRSLRFVFRDRSEYLISRSDTPQNLGLKHNDFIKIYSDPDSEDSDSDQDSEYADLDDSDELEELEDLADDDLT